MQIRMLKADCPQVQAVIAEIDQLMNSLYPAESNQLPAIEELTANNAHFIGVFDQQHLAACGAIITKRNDGFYGELKRIYVKPEFRGKGLSNRVMQALIDHAKEQGMPLIRLETGIKQSAAIQLYTKLGFETRSEFGDYDFDPLSVYMELKL